MTTQTEPKRLPKPSGWKLSGGGGFYIRPGQYGQRYMCIHCGKKSVGIHSARHMHWSTCHRHPDDAPAALSDGVDEGAK